MQPLILFGAFDRHNLGDLLLAHVAALEAAPRSVVCAGLAERDLTAWGGHRVHALPRLADEWATQRADLLHVGGELLTCQAYEAAVMLHSAADANAVIARLDRDPLGRDDWARKTLGLATPLPYLAGKALFRNPGKFEYHAIGGVEFDRLPPPARAYARARLGEAERVSVRDHLSQRHLAAIGLAAELVPDPVSRVATLFTGRIRQRADIGEVAVVRDAFPGGYLALQFAAEYGDDASLDRLAATLAKHRGDLVLFRAGAAPWHDNLAVYQRLAARLERPRIHLFRSLDIWDICALIAQAAAYCGTSLHGAILAHAFRIAVLPFPLPLRVGKLAAYRETWDTPR